jgi:hypothetical protein
MDEKLLMKLKRTGSLHIEKPMFVELLKAAIKKKELFSWLNEQGFKFTLETKKYMYFMIRDAEVNQDLPLVETSHELLQTIDEVNNSNIISDTNDSSRDSDSDIDSAHNEVLTMEEKLGGVINEHAFKPVRFIVAHSEVEKSRLENAIEMFNAVENADGSNIMILVGSKIIKESYDLKAIQNVFIVGRPDNIPTLIQIRGRAIRKGSHLALPEENRHVNILIFVTSRPDRKLSTEETKYKEKLEAFSIIQKINYVFNQNAVDAPLNSEVIDNYIANANDPLAPLPQQ